MAHSAYTTEKCFNGMDPNAFADLKSIPGIGPVWTAGILSEIGDIYIL